jgi:hypothetical protein
MCAYTYFQTLVRTIPYTRTYDLSTEHELIPAEDASLAAMHGSASGSNVRYYPT